MLRAFETIIYITALTGGVILIWFAVWANRYEKRKDDHAPEWIRAETEEDEECEQRAEDEAPRNP